MGICSSRCSRAIALSFRPPGFCSIDLRVTQLYDDQIGIPRHPNGHGGIAMHAAISPILGPYRAPIARWRHSLSRYHTGLPSSTRTIAYNPAAIATSKAVANTDHSIPRHPTSPHHSRSVLRMPTTPPSDVQEHRKLIARDDERRKHGIEQQIEPDLPQQTRQHITHRPTSRSRDGRSATPQKRRSPSELEWRPTTAKASQRRLRRPVSAAFHP